MTRWSWSAVALLVCSGNLWAAAATPLGDDWYPLGSRFTELTSIETIWLRHNALTWNGVPIAKAEVQTYVKRLAKLDPRPRICLKFARKDHSEAHRIAALIHSASGCDDGGCLFDVTGK